MTTDEVIKAVNGVIAQHTGFEIELMDELLTLSRGWAARYRELEQFEFDDDEVDD